MAIRALPICSSMKVSVTIRRVDYDLAAEVAALKTSGLPHADWVAQTLQKASFVMP